MVYVRRLLNPVGFLLVGLIFLLPFLTLGYGDEHSRIALAWHGTDLVTGGDSRLTVQEEIWDDKAHRYVMTDVSAEMAELQPDFRIRVPAQPAFMLATLLLVAGALAPILDRPRARALLAGGAALGAAGAVALGGWLAARAVLTTGFPESSTRGYTIEPFHHETAYGYWVAIGLLAVLAAGNGAVVFRRAGPRPAATPDTPLPAGPPVAS